MWPLVLLLLCCSGYWCHDCNKTGLYYVSRNFYNVLHWDTVDVPGQDVLYSVEYRQYGMSWRPMVKCQNISVTSCDLSAVTGDIYHRHYARVKTSSTCFENNTAFIPVEQTTLGAPEVSVSVAESSFSVMITTPQGPQSRSIKEISRDSSGTLHINYEIHLTHPTSKDGQVTRNTSGVVTLSNLEENTEYCGAAFYVWTHPYTRKLSQNTTFCVTVPAKSWVHVFIVPALLALLLLTAAALVPCQLYVTRKSRLPGVLNISKRTGPPCYPDLSVELADVRICSESPWKPVLPGPVMGGTNVGGSYAPQDGIDLPWQCNSYTNQQVEPVDGSNESATSYSMVVPSRVPEDLEESPDSANDSSEGPGPASCTGDGSDLYNEQAAQGPDQMDPDSNGELLPVSRDANGKLEFSMLTFLPELPGPAGLIAKDSENVPLVAPAGERTPLLDDLITTYETEWSDGELAPDYARTYVPNYVQQNVPEGPSSDAIPLTLLPDCTSSYRRNWEPRLSLESRFNDCIGKTGQLTESEDRQEDEEPLSRLGAIFLDGLVVQIHG